MQHLGEFIGRFHPVLVHLPIGVLLIAVLFIWLDHFRKMPIPPGIINLTLAVGSIGAVLSIVTGLLLSNSGDYDPDAVSKHQWLGISTGIVSIVLWLVRGAAGNTIMRSGSVVLVVLVTLTGHYGGSLTHGSNYLTAPLFDAGDSPTKTPDLSKINIDSAIFYADVIQPLFEARCYSCHGETKQKGGLRLDSPELIMKGGKNGKAIVAGNTEESDLVKRLELPDDDEDHMPPKEKAQLTERELKWIELWVRSGADFTKSISAVVAKKELDELQSSKGGEGFVLPDKNVAAPAESLMQRLTEKGVSISRLSRETNFLQANFISIPKEAPAVLVELKPLAKNILVLKLTSTEVDDDALAALVDFENLLNLSLAETKITDAGIDMLLKCTTLTHVNLESTGVTATGAMKLKALPKLKYLNVYKTNVTENERALLMEALPGVEIEFGGYDVPTLDTDTTRVKAR